MRSWLSVDLGAIKANARALAVRSAPARLCAVVKSDAYGHGLVPVGRALAEAAIDGLSLAVFEAPEASALRWAGIGLPLLVVGPLADGEARAMAEIGAQIAVLDADDPRRFAGSKARVHVKVETGTSRFGVRASDAPAVVEACRTSGLHVAGIYSHLANAEDLDLAFTREQLRRLASAADAVAAATQAGGAPMVRHLAASAAAMLWPQTRLDMVRCGIALYGYFPSPEVRGELGGAVALAPALRWFAPVAQVRAVAAGDSVGYGRAYVASDERTIAVLPVGYADGLPRACGDGALSVRFAAGIAPLVGRVCMNACMVDVTALRAKPSRGDVAELAVAEVARAAGTIEYEILARLPASLERRYV